MFFIRRGLNFLIKRFGIVTAIIAHTGISTGINVIAVLLFLDKMAHYIHSEDINNQHLFKFYYI